MDKIKKYLKDNYISKKIIRNKIKSLEEQCQNYIKEENAGVCENDLDIVEINSNIECLEELLKMQEENYNHIPRID